MLVALADTHADGPPPLTAHLRGVVRGADRLLHAGDFTAPETVDAFADLADGLAAVHGNSDDPAVRERLPAVRTVEALGLRVLLVHGHDHDRTSLPLLARQEGADLAVVGHTHAPVIETLGALPVVNPGSHAAPRGGTPAYARLRPAPAGEGGGGGGADRVVEAGGSRVWVQLRGAAGEPLS